MAQWNPFCTVELWYACQDTTFCKVYQFCKFGLEPVKDVWNAIESYLKNFKFCKKSHLILLITIT